jgi:RNA polymerase sigma-70 factor (ECF subfamily)
VERHERSVLATALASLREFHAAEDIVQSTFLTAFQQLDSLRDGNRFGAWVMQIARRQLVDVARTRRITVPLDEMNFSEALLADQTSDPDGRNYYLALVERLPEHEGLLIGLRHFDGHSVAEIAEMTGRPIGTVTKQLSRAHARLRDWLKEEDA